MLAVFATSERIGTEVASSIAFRKLTLKRVMKTAMLASMLRSNRRNVYCSGERKKKVSLTFRLQAIRIEQPSSDWRR